MSAQRNQQPDSSPIPPAGDLPRVLVSYSTDNLQNSPQRVHTALEALAGLPVSVLASTQRRV